MNKIKMSDVLKRNVMTIALFVIYVFFIIGTGGNMFTPSNVTSLIEQNAYVYILGVGMLMCMLTGGNIDLSVGSFVCFMGAIAGVFSVIKYVGTPLTLFIVVLVATIVEVLLLTLLSLPAIILSLANTQSMFGVAMGDPYALPSYMPALAAGTFLIIGFLQAYVMMSVLFPIYYMYGSIDAQEQEKQDFNKQQQ